MYASALVAAAVLLRTAAAIPAAVPEPTAAPVDMGINTELVARDGEAVNEGSPWVEVNDEGQPTKTHTPSLTTSRGEVKTVDAAPYSLTGSVYTDTWYGEVTTSTGLPPNPEAENSKTGQGAFSRCVNPADGGDEWAPFCRPFHNSTLFTGHTYYVTWDPDFFPKPSHNTSQEVSVSVRFFNHTSQTEEKLETFNSVPVGWGFYAWPLSKSHLRNDFDHDYTNVTIQLLLGAKGSEERNATGAKMPLVLEERRRPSNKPTEAPQGDTLKIALPAALGSVALIVLGIFLCNRKTRHIGLGNVMSRSRHGYTGAARRRIFRRNKDQGIQLDARAVPPEQSYRDDLAPPRGPRRDSDDLDSLAGSPVVDSFSRAGTTGGRNAFRDEMSRQDRLRQDEQRRY